MTGTVYAAAGTIASPPPIKVMNSIIALILDPERGGISAQKMTYLHPALCDPSSPRSVRPEKAHSARNEIFSSLRDGQTLDRRGLQIGPAAATNQSCAIVADRCHRRSPRPQFQADPAYRRSTEVSEETCCDTFMISSAAVLADAACRARHGQRSTPYSFDLQPPTTGETLRQMGGRNRGENPVWRRAGPPCSCAQTTTKNAHNGRAFLLTPRDVRAGAISLRAWARLPRYRLGRHDLRPAGGQPHDLDHVQQGKGPGIGTGSGNQWPISPTHRQGLGIEIIKPLAERTRRICQADQRIYRIQGDQHQEERLYGWEERAVRQDHRDLRHRPFRRTAPQLRPDSIMVIPALPPTRHSEGGEAAELTALSGALERITTKVVPFVPFTKLDGDAIRAPIAAAGDDPHMLLHMLPFWRDCVNAYG